VAARSSRGAGIARSWRGRGLLALLAIAGTCAIFASGAAVALAAASDPIFIFSPKPSPPPAPPIPPPNGFWNDPCGVAVDPAGNFYVADYYHHTVDLYSGTADYNSEKVDGATGYLGQLKDPDRLDRPCAIALGGGGELYLNEYHRSVRRFGPAPGFAPGPVLSGAGIDSSHPTSVAVDPASGRVYVDERTYVGLYEPSGDPVEEAGEPVRIGLGSLVDGYGVAVSAHPATAGYIYVADAGSDTVKVYDPASDKAAPVASIDGAPGGFNSLRDAAVAVDRVSGAVYVTDNRHPENTESPHALVDVFDAAGAYEGHLKFEVVDAGPPGLAVDNSATPTQGRVYVTSGNTHNGAIYAYPPGAATTAPPLVGPAPPRPLGGTLLFPLVAVGESTEATGPRIPCEGDDCQILPPQPRDPTLTTRVAGIGNPRVAYHRYAHKRHRKRRHGHRHKRGQKHRAATSRDTASAVGTGPEGDSSVLSPPTLPAGRGPVAAAVALSPVAAGFDARAWAEDGSVATIAGAHPYALRLNFGLDQPADEAGLRGLRLALPPGLLVDPATAALCADAAFAVPRSSAFETSLAGEDCQGRSQIGTVEAEAGSGEVRRFGLFNLAPPDGAFARFGAAPFDTPIAFDVHLVSDEDGSLHFAISSSEIPSSLALPGLVLTFWGTPWDASHNGERGDCLNEVEPSFPWGKCSAVGEPTSSPPIALLTLPTDCAGSLPFGATVETWSGATISAQALNRDAGGEAAPVAGCETLDFDPDVFGALTTKKVTTPSGFEFRLTHGDDGFVNPRLRAEPRAKKAVVELPDGVTLNPSLAAGLEGCTPAQLAAESATAQGCPNGSKIGEFDLTLPFFKGSIDGAIYLAQPHQNPFGSLLALYLVAKAADRGILVKARGKLTPDLADGTLNASFEGLSQLPYRELRIVLRSGQRAPLVSPPACGTATSRIELVSWAMDATLGPVAADSPLEAGVEGAPCPTATPPFAPRAIAGGVNSNANSYTPYFVHLSRTDIEQEITSYSLVLPEGVTGKLAGVPFCPDAAIGPARERDGFAETAQPSCPPASQVGRTVTGYGVGPSLAYAEGRVYLAGPYHGSPLSLVTINPATVGPFDLGTIVVRSAFDLDPTTAQLRIDSRASDPIPHILDGVVLHLRDIRVYLDRPEFTHNPTSCVPSPLESTLTGSGASFADPADDTTATAPDRFQLLNCRDLGFRPKLGLRLIGASRRGGYPALRATFAARGARDSNLARIEVAMPHQLFLAQNHIRAVCTRPQFAAERCPPGSVYGTAAAYTPLLDAPLRGNVYLRSSEGRLPDLVADLRSGSIRIVLQGQIGPSKHGGIRTFFDGLPDAPIDRFTLLMHGGRQGLFTNSVDVCAHPPRAAVKALGQNDVGAIFTTKLRGQCHKPHGAKRRHDHHAVAFDVVQKGTLRVGVDAKLSPRVLPRAGRAPIAASVSSRLTTTDGSTPPPLKALRIELNRHGRLETTGLPECRPDQIQPASTARALAACRGALVGRGSLSLDVVLGGQEPYPTTGQLLLFYGRHRGRPALLGQIYAPHPFANSFVIPFRIQREGKGRFGTALSAAFPPAFTSWGHITGLRMQLSRRYGFRGTRRSFLSAGCPVPRGTSLAVFPVARVSFVFAGGTTISQTPTGSCQVRKS
jgi:DNA-binding beta-propeller fold protein YncE